MMAATKKTKKNFVNFEKLLDELNHLIEKMETEQLNLATSLEYFEKGIALIKQCQQTLSDAEQKIQLLTEKSGKFTPQNFETDE